VGVASDERTLVLEDGPGGDRPIHMPMEVLLGKPPKMHRDVQRIARTETSSTSPTSSSKTPAHRVAPPHGRASGFSSRSATARSVA
jgi:phosphoribosylformylglycinamidine (FGAM) synthase-like enzyme